MTTATDTMRIFCKAKEAQDPYEAEVAPDISVSELVKGLNDVRYLPALAAGERWSVLHVRSSGSLTPNAKLDESDVEDGDLLEFSRDSHGAVM